MKNVELSFLDIAVDSLESSENVIDQMGPVRISHHLPEEHSGLSEIAVRVSRLISANKSSDLVLAGLGIRSHMEWPEGVGFVIRSASLVTINPHGSVSLPIRHFSSVGAVDGYLFIIGSQSVPMSVRVGEESCLEHFIKGRLYARDQVAWAECRLFNVLEVVLGVAIEDELADFDSRVVGMRPYLGDVEDVPFVFVAICLRHDLHLKGPADGVALGDMVE